MCFIRNSRVRSYCPNIYTVIEGLTWGDYTEELFDIGSSELDFIIGSDLFFDPEVFEPLLITISYLLEQKPDTGQFLSKYVFC